ncbi:MAG TPA: hypothetical protein H9859_10560 [Candidatus Barnesiella excrementigallinarum]|nr:hypothetical protein [Candidatus Barnesiella excrementigallinarum]
MQNQNSSLCVKNEFDVANVMKSFFNPNKKIFIFKETEIFFIRLFLGGEILLFPIHRFDVRKKQANDNICQIFHYLCRK